MKENISKEKEMEKGKNIIIVGNYYLKENIYMALKIKEKNIITKN